MQVIVILNRKAGSAAKNPADAAPEALRAAFAAENVTAEVRSVPPEEIEAALRTAVSNRPDAIIVGGGDGTIRSAAAILADTGVALGVLPLGTLNHFAKDLKMPPTLKDTVPALARGVVREVDVGEVNGHVFVNNCSLGSYAEAVRRRDELRERTGQGKWLAMLRASYRTFRRLRLLRLRLSPDDAPPRAVRTPLVVVANNRYSGRVLDSNMREKLDEGRLWLYTARVHRHLAALRMALQSLIHRLDAADALACEPVEKLVIENLRGPLPVAVDGEIVELQNPLNFRIRPRALRVLAPIETPSATRPSSAK